MASTPKKNDSGKSQTIPVKMVGTPSRTAAITLLLLLIGCGLGGAGFLYFKNNGTFFPRLTIAFLTVPPYEEGEHPVDSTHTPGLNPPGNGAATVVPQPPPLSTEIVIPTLPSPNDTAPTPTFSQIPDYPNRKPLPDAPLASMIEKAPGGLLLPMIDEQGRMPWKEYARPFRLPRETTPVGVIVRNLGLSDQATEAAINKLPPEITLAFSFGSPNLDYRVRAARAAGHEVLIELPLEPMNFPFVDTGPYSLLTTLPFAENEKRLYSILGRAGGYVGVLSPVPSRFSSSPQMPELLNVLEKRGLLYIGDLGTPSIQPPPGLPVAEITMAVDAQPFRAALDASLAQVLQNAETKGKRSIITLSPTPVALDRLLAWTADVQKTPNVIIAPVSAIVRSNKNYETAAPEDSEPPAEDPALPPSGEATPEQAPASPAAPPS